MRFTQVFEITVGLLAWSFIVMEAFKFWLNATMMNARGRSSEMRQRMMAGLLLIYSASFVAHHGMLVMREFHSSHIQQTSPTTPERTTVFPWPCGGPDRPIEL